MLARQAALVPGSVPSQVHCMLLLQLLDLLLNSVPASACDNRHKIFRWQATNLDAENPAGSCKALSLLSLLKICYIWELEHAWPSGPSQILLSVLEVLTMPQTTYAMNEVRSVIFGHPACAEHGT